MGNAIDYSHYKKECIDGKIYFMSPLANPKHGKVIGNLYLEFATYLKRKTCQVYTDNLAIYLDETSKNYVVPDLSILCDKDNFKSNGYHGIPSLVVEVLSHSNIGRDRIDKFKLYEKFGIPEYWIVDYVGKTVEQYLLVQGKYELKASIGLIDNEEYDNLDERDRANYTTIINPSLFDDLEIDLKDVFEGL